jgi:hypothetical protein
MISTVFFWRLAFRYLLLANGHWQNLSVKKWKNHKKKQYVIFYNKSIFIKQINYF